MSEEYNDYRHLDGEIYYSLYTYEGLCSFHSRWLRITGKVMKVQRRLDRAYIRGFRKYRRASLGCPRDGGSIF